jgi:hypothetical protein
MIRSIKEAQAVLKEEIFNAYMEDLNKLQELITDEEFETVKKIIDPDEEVYIYFDNPRNSKYNMSIKNGIYYMSIKNGIHYDSDNDIQTIIIYRDDKETMTLIFQQVGIYYYYPTRDSWYEG